MEKILSDKKLFVAGGTGGIGEGIARQLLNAGATVIIPVRSPEKVVEVRQRFIEEVDRLITIEGDVGDSDDVERVRDEVVKKVGSIDGVVVVIGTRVEGELLNLSLEEWHKAIEGNLTAHYLIARTFLPLIAERPGTSYTLINGISALVPFAGNGVLSVVAAAQLMMKNVLAAENAQKPVRINTLLLASQIATRSRKTVMPEWPTSDEVGQYAAYIVSDKGSGIKGETVTFRHRSELPKLV